MIIVEGPRNCGKSYLISNIIFKRMFKKYKFSFADFDRSFRFDESAAVNFAMGKDFQILKLAQDKMLKDGILMDRGPISSIVYGLLNGRMDMDFADELIKEIIKLLKCSGIHIIYVYGKNPIERKNKDKWDEMEYGKQKQMYDTIFSKIESCYFLNKTSFENKFNSESILSFNKLIFELFSIRGV